MTSATPATAEPEREFVQAFARGLAVIKTFGPETPEMTLSEVARRAEVSRATARRSLQTLETLGYVATDGSRWRLLPRILELGYAYLGTVPIWQLVRPRVEALTTTLREPATVAVLDGDDIVYTVSTLVPGLMTMAMTIGTRIPAHLTAAGRLLLGGLAEQDFEIYLEKLELTPVTDRTVTDKGELARAVASSRTAGHCIVDRELWPNIRTVAAPIHDEAGQVIAAVQVCCHAGEVSMAALKSRVVPALLAAAAEIDHDVALRR